MYADHNFLACRNMAKFTLPMFLLLQVVLAAAATTATPSTTNFAPRVTEVCNSTLFSDNHEFCLKLLNPYASQLKDADPNKLAHVAISACLSKAQSSKAYMAQQATVIDMSASQRAAIKDCLDKVTDSIDSLRQAAREFEEMRQVKGDEQEYHMENVIGKIVSSGDDQKACSDLLYGVHGIEIDGHIIQQVQEQAKEAAEASLVKTEMMDLDLQLHQQLLLAITFTWLMWEILQLSYQ
ncbi:hypothetical protein RD792_013680 [Penstemon davidsonii]|uniref:Pectinesterase inhibitor domain-containing protein n=1 Tax=Penstemon davidsonii TaxID=160366 RepID=A0ABR0CUM0_9LAMI|nr:hypothetical protein RD792_013680 [Penstemon davidsonii]